MRACVCSDCVKCLLEVNVMELRTEKCIEGSKVMECAQNSLDVRKIIFGVICQQRNYFLNIQKPHTRDDHSGENISFYESLTRPKGTLRLQNG